jgi:hypothetical protein
MKIKHTGRVAGVMALGVLLGCLGGSGSTDGGSGENPGYKDDVFVSGDETTGSLKIVVNESELAVGATTGFQVQVRNASGQPVPNIYVVCDSEDGISLVEPTTGRELTDAGGNMSGRIGCERPGSFQMLCRLTVGANRRKFAGIKCSGNGYQDFPNAGGGGLGGGVQDADDGGAQVTSVAVYDGATSASTSNQIDVTQDLDCDDSTSTTTDVEPFYDTFARVVVQNNFSETVTFSYLSYSVSDIDGQGSDFDSPRLGVTAVASASGGTASMVIPIFKGYQASKWAGDPLSDGIEIAPVGFRTITIVAYGQTASGKSVELTALVTASFGDFNACTTTAS